MPLKGRANRRSVQAQDPYDVSGEGAALEQTISRLKRVGALLYAVVSHTLSAKALGVSRVLRK